MAKYYTFNGLNNKSLVRKLAKIKQMPSCATICWFRCSELFGEKAETGELTYIVFLCTKQKSW